MIERPTDPAYEESRRKAEQAFYHGFEDWLRKLAEEARRDRPREGTEEWFELKLSSEDGFPLRKPLES